MSRQGIIRRGKVYRQYNIKSCKYAAGKIDPQSLPGNTLKGGILFTVENSGNGSAPKKIVRYTTADMRTTAAMA